MTDRITELERRMKTEAPIGYIGDVLDMLPALIAAVKLLKCVKLGEGGLFLDDYGDGSIRACEYDWIVAEDNLLAKLDGKVK